MRIVNYWISVLGVSLLCAGCAHYPRNPRLDHYDYRAGYRFGNCTDPSSEEQHNPDDLFIVLCFSGGGTRAAAFSYGVLEYLQKTENPTDEHHRPLLDEVDVISSVSGGSFTAAYYGIYRDGIFSDFETRFLKRNVQGELMLCVLNPINGWRLASPFFSRIDLASEYYSDEIFGDSTFGDLAASHRRPFIVLNAADMSLGARFEFTQDQFDLLYSDLSGVQVARGVAASSAFPVLLCPMTFKNYPSRPDYQEPAWLQNALTTRTISPRRYERAKQVKSYLDAESKPYVHLIDGGVSDNIGMRGMWQSIEYPDLLAPPVEDPRGLNMQRLVNEKRIRKLVFIAVNAKPGGSDARDRSAATPGLIDVVENIATVPMENYSFDTLELMRQSVKQRKKDASQLPDQSSPWAQLKTYFIQIDFEGLADADERRFLQGLDTNYDLTDDAVDRLRRAAGLLLKESKDFEKLRGDLNEEAANRVVTKPG